LSEQASNARDRPLRGLAFMLAASASFTAMNAATAMLGRRGVSWQVAAFARAFVGLSIALLVARARGASLGIADARVMWTRSLAGSASMLMTFYALTHMPLADATALLNTTPLWIAMLAWIMLDERPGRGVALAIAIAVLGVWFVERPSFARRELTGLVALGAGAASALAMVSLRRLGRETPEAVVVHFSAVASTVTLLAVLARGLDAKALTLPRDAPSWIAVIGVGLFATGGQLAMTRAYSLDRAARVGAAGWAQVVFALLLDGLARGRWPDHAAAIGIALLLFAGLVLIESARRAERPKST
jgi:drug/metabolite transporter (DMT)-like permease